MKKSSREKAVWVDFGHDSVRIQVGDSQLDPVVIERDARGALTDACRERVREAIDGVQSSGKRAGAPIHCALPARGATVRTLRVPKVSKDEARRLLALQVERELPVDPEDLAWGYEVEAGQNGSGDLATIVALRRDIVRDYERVFEGLGREIRFSLGALAMAERFRSAAPTVVLDIGRRRTEAALFVEGRPAGVRVLPCGGEKITEAIASRLEVESPEAETIKRSGSLPDAARVAVEASLDGIAARIAEAVKAMTSAAAPADGSRIEVAEIVATGGAARTPGLAEAIASRLPEARVRVIADESASSAVLAGLSAETSATKSGIVFEVQPPTTAPERGPRFVPWIAAAVVAGVLALFAPDAALFRLATIEAEIASLEAKRDAMPPIDGEFAFLRTVDEAQLPIVELLAVLAVAAPDGFAFSSLDWGADRRLTLRASVADLQTMNAFQSKLQDEHGFIYQDDDYELKDGRVVFTYTASVPKLRGVPRDGEKIPSSASLPPAAPVPAKDDEAEKDGETEATPEGVEPAATEVAPANDAPGTPSPTPAPTGDSSAPTSRPIEEIVIQPGSGISGETHSIQLPDGTTIDIPVSGNGAADIPPEVLEELFKSGNRVLIPSGGGSPN